LHLTRFWKCLAGADFIKDLIWRVQLLNAHVFFSSLYMLFMSTGTYNYKFYADYWSLYKIQVLSWHVQWHYLHFNKNILRKKTLTYVVLVLWLQTRVLWTLVSVK
jgi:hypothetical protein